tara:strand:- start:31825 stop:32049 length:225 start_codon:yes stop_codon:yes gene_type:complete
MPDPAPKPLFRVVDAETGEPVKAWTVKGHPCFMLDTCGRVWRLLYDGILEERPNLRVEWLLDPTTGKPPRRPGV